jgi:hypothetical protein
VSEPDPSRTYFDIVRSISQDPAVRASVDKAEAAMGAMAKAAAAAIPTPDPPDCRGYTVRDLRHAAYAIGAGALAACIITIVLVHVIWNVPT